MLELLKSLVFAVIMVPVVMAVILGLIYGLGEVFNIFSSIGQKDQSRQNHCFPKRPLSRAFIFFACQLVFSRSCFPCRYFLCVTSNWYQ